ncbi:hypothetical protein B0T26DRAFT_490991 [Lasiosphaeria miniovina]|uniref:Uncharacterized protein n=1 Tax=Lasiosphaeria miniovina TaxID=1954250 RepID=A0AA40DKH1_9PEZI|nr:uncharacterized protein B0T26DRAFT_490991 [Lasiosphaeria miniovina]KAK0703143.1 hypothetical protein B0T26DRAFT_490991 [Lasiosphaeria miniovina]
MTAEPDSAKMARALDDNDNDLKFGMAMYRSEAKFIREQFAEQIHNFERSFQEIKIIAKAFLIKCERITPHRSIRNDTTFSKIICQFIEYSNTILGILDFMKFETGFYGGGDPVMEDHVRGAQKTALRLVEGYILLKNVASLPGADEGLEYGRHIKVSGDTLLLRSANMRSTNDPRSTRSANWRSAPILDPILRNPGTPWHKYIAILEHKNLQQGSVRDMINQFSRYSLLEPKGGDSPQSSNRPELFREEYQPAFRIWVPYYGTMRLRTDIRIFDKMAKSLIRAAYIREHGVPPDDNSTEIARITKELKHKVMGFKSHYHRVMKSVNVPVQAFPGKKRAYMVDNLGNLKFEAMNTVLEYPDMDGAVLRVRPHTLMVEHLGMHEVVQYEIAHHGKPLSWSLKEGEYRELE